MQKKYDDNEELYCDYCRLIVHPRDAGQGEGYWGEKFPCCPSCETELEVYDGQELDEDLYCVNCIRRFSINDAEYCEDKEIFFCPICGNKLITAK